MVEQLLLNKQSARPPIIMKLAVINLIAPANHEGEFRVNSESGHQLWPFFGPLESDRPLAKS
jgi:hypothetical protein